MSAYDEKLWAELPDATRCRLKFHWDLLEPLHRRWVALFESLTEEQWQRGYVHSEADARSWLRSFKPMRGIVGTT